MPILIPDLDYERQKQFLDEVDGFVFSGGVDVSPESYSEVGINNNRWAGDRYRDEYELKILEYARNSKKPVFGICRGMQIINVGMGGTLYQDLQTQTGTTRNHRDAVKYDTIKHTVDVCSDGILKKIYKKDHLNVNTVHHQGVKDLAKNLILEASCPDDDLCEAFRSSNMEEHYILGVQWHPEFSPSLQNEVEDPAPLFDDFLEAVKIFKGK